MPSHALDQRLFEQMNNLFEEDGDITATPADGVQLIDKWLKVIEGEGAQKTVSIEARLKELRGALQFAQPDPDRIRGLLLTLAEHTNQIAQGSDLQEPTVKKLADLAQTLQDFSGQF